MALFPFLVNVVAISLSGVMAPGPVTAATLTYGARSRLAGMWIAIGHGILEMPLIFLLMIGLAPYLKMDGFKVVVGLVGGTFLLWMVFGMIQQARHPNPLAAAPTKAGPIATGFALSASSPYFLFWWASTGLILTSQAKELGWLAFGLFALVHWLCDLLWLTILSLTAFHGRQFLNDRNQRIILYGCGAVMAWFAVMFLMDSIHLIFR
ncbi:MAG: LysE family transporter [Phycisphaerae bacterium]|nr:LysE family transporter [Phycisphaerae bacterium]